MSKNVVVSLCDKTGNMVKPWAEAGYECICVDLDHSIRSTRKHGGQKKNGIRYVWGDIRQWSPERYDNIAAFFSAPPCTHLAVSGSQDWETKGLLLLMDALFLIERCRQMAAFAEAHGAITVMENPVGRLSTLWKKPDYYFNPNEYAGYLPEGVLRQNEAYTKKTGLWTSKGFRMPPKKEVPPHLGTKMHTLSPGPNRAALRSETPLGFSYAVQQANDPCILRLAA